MLNNLTSLAALIVTELPDPGRGTQPPGTEGITTIVQWVAWIAAALCLIGALIAGGMMAVQLNRGSGGESVARLGWALVGAVVVGAAAALVGALI
ncbi:hypothetical protein EHW97_14865 [Aeromicrobium camelliae]|uniref:Conjugal transfer protein TrbC n=1 Tax=Aeromicrobium camelliae TaxID=1538144 RepID=A0A3N6XWF4_9ACTN|nr:hypothetical protein [Aeromicrobium camelliae]RQN02034.1 hypothetical protein EHW97_14865 [Aeromicrobium camelliae]